MLEDNGDQRAVYHMVDFKEQKRSFLFHWQTVCFAPTMGLEVDGACS